MSWLLSDYRCPSCQATFETLRRRDDPGMPPCPICGTTSERILSPVFGRVNPISVVRGKHEGPRHAGDLDTRPLAEGMPVSEWRDQQRKKRRDNRWREIKDTLS